MEQTFVMIKPDGVERGLIGEIIVRFQRKGFRIVDAKLMKVSKETAERHYFELKEKPFFGELVNFITSGPIFAMVLEGRNAVQNARLLIGATNPAVATAGTIRGDFATDLASNVIHGSDSDENAAREIDLFFQRQRDFAIYIS
ncbi:nucleoside-diphosphate kinase [Paenibacillus alkaliterrae]|uniref:nucleoside-diphosphate kinase n=1 Tax=Paenibacillus alkaliterrae TaxID=320909 RepID=UPI001F1C2B53|nr:nucleoside-diphosphate kinase [Paenibacillus alkaliterrae]MCF2941572.1 nucleoside-diphosphate kinase [Paenibacillus alkaliterrae]